MNAPNYLSRLRQKNEEINAPASNCIKPVKDFTQFVQFALGANKDVFSKAAPTVTPGATEKSAASRWWLLHYPNRDSMEVACCPEATHADILGQHPDPVAAVPFTPPPYTQVVN